MLFKTKGIALNYVKFKESSIIARVYTKRFGLQSYMINGIRSKQAKRSIGHFQPLTLLDLVVYHRPGKDIHRLSEYRISQIYQHLPFEIKKTTIALFISEFLLRVVGEEEEQEEQFEFIWNSLEILDRLAEGYENFHLHFLIRISRYLGIGISSVKELRSNTITETDSARLEQFISALISNPYENSIPSSGILRQQTLSVLMRYFRDHYDHWHEMKSTKVLSQIFH